MLHIVMIDDDVDVTATVKSAVSDHVGNCRFKSFDDFDEGAAALVDTRPDVVILDLFMDNPITGQNKGRPIWESLWENHFCPIIIYSAYASEFTGPQDHPFVRSVDKGGGTDVAVAEIISQFSPIMLGLRGVKESVERSIGTVLRHIAPHAFSLDGGDEFQTEVLLRASRRRLSAMMDDVDVVDERPIESWEQYIFPVLTEHLLAGDVLRQNSQAEQSACLYRLVLTPTCDMVKHGEQFGVSQVLTARCVDAAEFVIRGLNVQTDAKSDTAKKKIRGAMNEPHQGGLVMLPECPGVFPPMAVDLRQLDLVSIESICRADNKEYERVASLDSPFREFVMWAYVQIAGRPGVPPRNHKVVENALHTQWKEIKEKNS